MRVCEEGGNYCVHPEFRILCAVYIWYDCGGTEKQCLCQRFRTAMGTSDDHNLMCCGPYKTEIQSACHPSVEKSDVGCVSR